MDDPGLLSILEQRLSAQDRVPLLDQEPRFHSREVVRKDGDLGDRLPAGNRLLGGPGDWQIETTFRLMKTHAVSSET